jgi:hypothetical protein
MAVNLEDHFTAFRIQCSQFHPQKFDVHVHVSMTQFPDMVSRNLILTAIY